MCNWHIFTNVLLYFIETALKIYITYMVDLQIRFLILVSLILLTFCHLEFFLVLIYFYAFCATIYAPMRAKISQ